MPVPGPLVSTQWLADHLGGDDLVVLDATVLPVEGGGYVSGDEEFLVHGHIPGAHSADLIEQFSDPGARFAFTRPSREQFERVAGEHGISNASTRRRGRIDYATVSAASGSAAHSLSDPS
jgi:thiosulfate/3-mercaptopyruvate sulfurtransferase